jgi:hypothetical protein
MRVVKGMPMETRVPIVEIWLDQVMHITILAAVALWVGVK